MTKQYKQELAVFLPVVLAIVGAIGGEWLLSHLFGQVQALRGIAVGSLIGVLLLSRQAIAFEREVHKLRQPPNTAV